MPLLGLILDVLTLFVLVAYALSLLAAWVPLTGTVVDQAHEARRRLLLAPVGALGIVVLGFWPSVFAAVTGRPDHCGTAVGHHPHLCWLHLSATPDGHHDLAIVLILGVVLLAGLWQGFHWALALGRLRLIMAATAPAREAQFREAGGEKWPWPVTVVNVGIPMCFVRGVLRPHLVISTALLNAFTPEELRLVVAHEAAHIARGDNFWRIAGRLLSLAHLPGLGQRSYERWVVAAEAACDEKAAEAVGSRVQVAEALVRYQRLVNQHLQQPQWGSAFGPDQALQARVNLLLSPPPSVPWRALLPLWPWALVLLLGFQAEGIHDLLEDLLGLLHL